MKHFKKYPALALCGVLALTLLLVEAKCSKLEQNARDTAAALNGAIVSAQAHYQTSCTANPSQTPCQTINRAVSGQNALITAIDAYCGWSANTPPANPNAPCVPVKGAEQSLNAAVLNANTLINQLKGL